MERYITLGADEHGQVYGLELNDDGTWRRNPLGYATSCVVISPMKKETYDYITEDPESAKELWQQCVAANETDKGLDEWFEDYKDSGDLFDVSFVSELLDDEDNPTVSKWEEDHIEDAGIEDVDIEDVGPAFESFREYVNDALINSEEVKSVNGENDVYEWESSGLFPPKRPFVVEFAPRKLLDEYYAHLRRTYKGFKV
jgi:hypothetical protein